MSHSQRNVTFHLSSNQRTSWGQESYSSIGIAVFQIEVSVDCQLEFKVLQDREEPPQFKGVVDASH